MKKASTSELRCRLDDALVKLVKHGFVDQLRVCLIRCAWWHIMRLRGRQ